MEILFFVLLLPCVSFFHLWEHRDMTAELDILKGKISGLADGPAVSELTARDWAVLDLSATSIMIRRGLTLNGDTAARRYGIPFLLSLLLALLVNGWLAAVYAFLVVVRNILTGVRIARDGSGWSVFFAKTRLFGNV